MDVIVKSGQGLVQEVEAGRHRFMVDEPLEYGGSGTAPTPYDLLMAALGACTSMTMQMYAKVKGWPLEGVTIRLTHKKIHARDCADCETRDGRIDHVVRTIELRGPLDDEQRARLLLIAEKCPVHRTLHSEVRVETRLATG
jgi:putative redox protein